MVARGFGTDSASMNKKFRIVAHVTNHFPETVRAETHNQEMACCVHDRVSLCLSQGREWGRATSALNFDFAWAFFELASRILVCSQDLFFSTPTIGAICLCFEATVWIRHKTCFSHLGVLPLTQLHRIRWHCARSSSAKVRRRKTGRMWRSRSCSW